MLLASWYNSLVGANGCSFACVFSSSFYVLMMAPTTKTKTVMMMMMMAVAVVLLSFFYFDCRLAHKYIRVENLNMIFRLTRLNVLFCIVTFVKMIKIFKHFYIHKTALSMYAVFPGFSSKPENFLVCLERVCVCFRWKFVLSTTSILAFFQIFLSIRFRVLVSVVWLSVIALKMGKC